MRPAGSLAWLRGGLVGLAALVLASAGCYRIRQPPQIGEPVRVEVVSDQGRLIQAQTYLHAALASSLNSRLGWHVTPDGSARLEIAIAREAIDIAARDSRGVPNRWMVRLNGSALLVCQKGNVFEPFTGVGYSTGLIDEDEALRVAANNAAYTLTSWLETEVKTLR